MIIRYLLEKLDKEGQGLQKVWAILQHIKETLELSEPSDSILVSLNPEDYAIKIPPVQIIAVLEDLQKKGILKILKKNESTPSPNTKFIEIDREKFNSEYKKVKNWPKRKEKQVTQISFDKKLCILKYEGKQYKPQRKRGRCQILKTLWTGRRIIDTNGKTKKEGQYFGIDELAIAANFVEDLEGFKEKPKTAERNVRDAIQDLRDKLNEMKVPVEIVAQNGFMLIVKE